MDKESNSTTQPENSEAGKTEDKSESPETFTQDQVNDIVSKRIAEVSAKADKKLKDEVAKAIADTERRSKLSEAEKEKELKVKQEEALKARENAVTLRERRADAKDELSRRNIDTELVDFVVDVDEDKTNENIEKLTKAFNDAVSRGVKAKLAGTAPEDYADNPEKQSTEKKHTGGLTAF